MFWNYVATVMSARSINVTRRWYIVRAWSLGLGSCHSFFVYDENPSYEYVMCSAVGFEVVGRYTPTI